MGLQYKAAQICLTPFIKVSSIENSMLLQNIFFYILIMYRRYVIRLFIDLLKYERRHLDKILLENFHTVPQKKPST